MKTTLIAIFIFCELLRPFKAHFLRQPTVILISFDGFRWDYMNKTRTKSLDFIVKTGVKAKFINNTFVTKTFPNHYTIVTGLYEESHGIVANTMYDPVFKSWFHLDNNESRWWNDGEPLWVTNQKEGGKSGTVFWPGSDVKIRGQYPTYYMKYNYKLSYKARVDKIIELLNMKTPPSFLTLYFEEPDHSGHRHGPDSKEVMDGIHKVDNATGYLLNQLRTKGLLDEVNIIITSDHGMTSISPNRTIYLSDYIPSNIYTSEFSRTGDAFLLLWPKEGKKDQIYNSLKDVTNMEVYKKESIPTEYHYTKNRRIAPILVVGKLGWSIAVNRSVKVTGHGNHGYSNRYKDMHPFFIGRGPVFKKGYISEPFNNVDIYPLICHILGITPAPNNGSLTRVSGLLVTSSINNNYILLITVSTISILVMILMTYGIISLYLKHHRRVNRYRQFECLQRIDVNNEI